ncbi:MAG: S1-like domain-containing RNA-binding protein [Lachnospiraceae bacterium]|nr:S1-like domain-containing RNA-binding protein [Lachnospiraceae bacterium]
MQLGKKQVLTVVKEVDFGVYLGSEAERVLLPKKQVPEGIEIGDPIEVFLYKDSDDRLIATTNTPKLELEEVALLEVADVGKFGAFLNWGLEKDLFLPFKEQTTKVAPGDQCLVTLYIDKSSRLCASMKVYEFLRKDSPYIKDDQVSGIIYETSEDFGVFVAVDNIYSALIPKKEAYGKLEIGSIIEARVVEVKPDGKLDLAVRAKIPEQMDKDAIMVWEALEKRGGELPFTDKADPEIIKFELNLSKNAFKRAVGRLLKEGKIDIHEKTIAIRKK